MARAREPYGGVQGQLFHPVPTTSMYGILWRCASRILTFILSSHEPRRLRRGPLHLKGRLQQKPSFETGAMRVTTVHAAITKLEAGTQGAPDDHPAAVGAQRCVGDDDLSRREPAPDGSPTDRPQARRGAGGLRGRLGIGRRAFHPNPGRWNPAGSGAQGRQRPRRQAHPRAEQSDSPQGMGGAVGKERREVGFPQWTRLFGAVEWSLAGASA